MVFSSHVFIYYFCPIALLIYFSLYKAPQRARNLALLGYLFYGWANPKFTFLMFGTTDTHWSPAACVLAARLVKEQLKGRDWLTPAGAMPFTAKESDMTFQGDLARSLSGESAQKESLPARVITAADGRETVSQTSPVLLLGDSHCLVFHLGDDMLGVGAGFVDQLAYELQMPVDLLGTRGSGATPTRINLLQRARADAKYLPAKKLVIWCFAAREFTEGQGWRKVPVVK